MITIGLGYEALKNIPDLEREIFGLMASKGYVKVGEPSNNPDQRMVIMVFESIEQESQTPIISE